MKTGEKFENIDALINIKLFIYLTGFSPEIKRKYKRNVNG